VFTTPTQIRFSIDLYTDPVYSAATMKLQTSVFSLSILTTFGVLAAAASAQTQTTPSPLEKDNHPYQSQTMLYFESGAPQALTSVVRSYSVNGAGNKLKTVSSTTLFEQNVAAPALIAQGSNFAFLDGKILQTVSADGFVSTSIPLTYTSETVGGVYFTKKSTRELVIVDSYGSYYETGIIAASIPFAGGNFFIDSDHKLTTIKSSGLYYTGTDGNRYRGWAGMKSTYTEDMSSVDRVGGNYWVNGDGTLGTVNSETGLYYNHLTNDSRPKRFGGNFFIGEDSILYTVNYAGFIKKFSKIDVEKVKHVGSSYIEFNDETLLTIDYDGMTHSSSIEFPSGGGAVVEVETLPSAISVAPINSF
jgi:hypothetical protein